MSESDRCVVLVGPMGAGKSSIGRRVAKALDRAFLDTDTMIVRSHGAIPRIFAEHGEAHFRALERAAVSEALASGGIVALGGGAVLDPDTRTDLKAHRVVLLSVDARVIGSRIAAGGRPLLAGDEDPVARWTRIRDERWPLYEEVADVTFDTSRGRLAGVADDVAAWVKGEGA